MGATLEGVPVYYVNYRELAALLDISTRTLRRLVERGELPAPRRFGHAVRFSLLEIEEALRRLPRAGVDVQC